MKVNRSQTVSAHQIHLKGLTILINRFIEALTPAVVSRGSVSFLVELNAFASLHLKTEVIRMIRLFRKCSGTHIRL